MPRLNLEHIVNTLRQVLPDISNFIPLHEPQFKGQEWKYVKECLDTGWVSTAGKFVEQFEAKLVDYTKAKYAIAVNNGTAALHVALHLVGVQEGDEVLIPSLTFVATANTVAYCKAIPHFVDSEEKTLGIDPNKLAEYLHKVAEVREGGCFNQQTGRRIKAMVPMHTFGHPVQIEQLLQICQQYQLTLVEDAAESLGSFYQGKHTGNWGKISVLSFNGNKVVTTGGGGALLTNDESLAKLAKHLTTTAKLSHNWEYRHDQIGFNYRLPNINAALGCAQMERLSYFVEQKRLLADRYKQAFLNIEGILFFTEPEGARSNYWLNVLLLDEHHASFRDPLLELTNSQKIMTRPIWTPMHQLKMFQQAPQMDLTTAESLSRRLINIPSSAILGNA